MLHKSQIELFVEAYLKRIRNTNNIRSERKFIEKAIILIDLFLGEPCCTDPDAVVEYTPHDNQLTLFIIGQLQPDANRRELRKSLERTKTLLSNALEDPCCP